MAAFRFSLAAALAKRRGELERAEFARRQAEAAAERARAHVADLEEELQLAELRLRAARAALAEPDPSPVDVMVELTNCGRLQAAAGAIARLLRAIDAARGEVLRHAEQVALRAQDECRCNAAVRALDELQAQERRSFLRACERRADSQRLDDALLRWRPPAAGAARE